MTDSALHAPAHKVADETYLRAISEIESGNKDDAIGPHGEVSRYQLKPSVWVCYSASKRYSDPAISHYVAMRHLHHLRALFTSKVKETPFLIGLLWHLGDKRCLPLFQNHHINLSPEERDYAQRFANLVEAERMGR